jgi:hypothetical protein
MIGKMLEDEITVDEMSAGKMTVDEITGRLNVCRQNDCR